MCLANSQKAAPFALSQSLQKQLRKERQRSRKHVGDQRESANIERLKKATDRVTVASCRPTRWGLKVIAAAELLLQVRAANQTATQLGDKLSSSNRGNRGHERGK